jgi:hypothetical protein
MRRAVKSRKVKPLAGVKVRLAKRKKVVGAKRHRKGKSMPKKLYGAAAAARAKKLAKRRRRKARQNPARRVKSSVRKHMMAAMKAGQYKIKRKRRKGKKVARKSSKRSRAAKKAARTRALKKAARSASARKAARKRKHGGRKVAARRRRKSSSRRSHSPKRRRKARKSRKSSRRRRSSRRRTGIPTLRRARRSIKRARRGKQGRLARAYAKRWRMRSNPSGGVLGMLKTAVMAALPVAASLYLTRVLVNKLAPMIPGVDKLGAFSRPAVSTGVLVAAHFATRKGPLAKHRPGIMLGATINLVDSVVSAFAPSEIKGMFGLGDSGLYDGAMGEYREMSDYIGVGATPLDDRMTLSDYIGVGDIEQELGAIQQELGVEEDLGLLEQELGDDLLGGVSQSSMLAPIPSRTFEAPIPQRSWTKRVPRASENYDNPGSLNTGIFARGF